jgi:hypothetical protein
MSKLFGTVMALALAVTTADAAGEAQGAKRGKTAVHDITVKADAVYTGKMELAVDKGKVTGDMLLTTPTEIKGKVTGTSKAGVLALDFPYTITERGCSGTVKMNIKLPAKPGPAQGTMEATGCGDASQGVTGTVELSAPLPAKPPATKK